MSNVEDRTRQEVGETTTEWRFLAIIRIY